MDEDTMSNDELLDTAGSKAVMLTTVDNPYNPFTDFDDWQQFDESKGYFTCEYLARIAKIGNELSEQQEQQAIASAIDEIVKMNVLGIYKKVYETGAGGTKN